MVSLRNLRRPEKRPWGLVALALLMGILIGAFIIPHLYAPKLKEFAVYTKHVTATRVGPFQLSFHKEGKYVGVDVTFIGTTQAQLETLYIDAGHDFTRTREGRVSSVQYQTLHEYGTFEGTMPAKFLKGETEHIRLYPIPSEYNSGQVTGYMIKLGYK